MPSFVATCALFLSGIVLRTEQAFLRSPDAAEGQLRPYQDPRAIPDHLPNLFGEGTLGRSEGRSLVAQEPAASKLAAPSGVVCRTLLHPQLRERYVKVFYASMLDQATADELDHEIEEECQKLFEPDVWPQLSNGYTGSWSDTPPVDAESVVFVPIAAWMNAKRDASLGPPGSWNDVTKGGTAGRDTADRIEAVRRRQSGAPPLTRIMDFGCGDGTDLSGAASHLGIDAADALGLDIGDFRDAETRDGFTFLHADIDNYDTSLQNLLGSVAGTVSFGWSFVTFHHIVEPQQRVAALGFIRDSLVEDGIFLLAEWDNPVAHGPLDFTIYYDLQHILPILLFGNPVTTDRQEWIGYVERPMGTEYLSAEGWIDTFSANGLEYDSQRSLVPGPDNSTGELSLKGTAWMVENWPQRNFQAVFSKHQML